MPCNRRGAVVLGGLQPLPEVPGKQIQPPAAAAPFPAAVRLPARLLAQVVATADVAFYTASAFLAASCKRAFMYYT